MAPQLEHLGTNVHRNGTWPLETFDVIASMPSLRSLDLWLDIVSDCRRQKPDGYSRPKVLDEWRMANGECKGEDQYQKPIVNGTSALEVFKYLQDKKVGDSLSNVTFWVGDWSRPWDGALYFPEWIEGKRSKVACSTEGKLEGEQWCVVEEGRNYWNRSDHWSRWDDDEWIDI